MGYKKTIEVIENKVAQARGNLFFELGTDRDFNSNENRNFPLVHLGTPATSAKFQNAQGLIVREQFNFQLRVLQATNIESSTVEIERLLDNTNLILIALLNELSAQDVQFSIGTASQLRKSSDLLIVGWTIPLNVQSDVDYSLCCSLFT
jgi:hypothetical protein